MIEYNTIETILSNNNTKKIKYIILFFIFVFALSQNLFSNVFGCRLSDLSKNKWVKHGIIILFLYLIVDINFENAEQYTNPIVGLVYSIFMYILVILLLHCNKIYIYFIISIILLLLGLDKFKTYYENTIKDQENLQTKLGLIYKTYNVFVIIMILTIIICSLTSIKLKSIYNIVFKNMETC